MKKLLYTTLVAVAMTLGAFAQSTNETQASNASSEGKSEVGSYEFTLGGGGFTIEKETEFGLDFSISSNPFKRLPNLWVGLNQGLVFEPSFTGSTDLNLNWNWHLYKNLYLNTGWSAGVVYGDEQTESEVIDELGETSTLLTERFNYTYRTGPEVTFQYYVSDSAFVYTGVNYDIVSEGKNGFRYSFGIGIAF